MARLPGFPEWVRQQVSTWNDPVAELARRSGLSVSGVSRILSGESQGSKRDTQVAIAQAFGLTHDQLVKAVREGSAPEDFDVHDGLSPVERAIRRDPNLTTTQADALLVHYQSYVRPQQTERGSR